MLLLNPPVKIWSDFPPAQCIVHNLVHPRWNVGKVIFPGEFRTFITMSFDINTVILLRQCSVSNSVLSGSQQSVVTNLPWWNLTLARRFWAAKVCLQESKTSKVCLFGCPTGRATFWKPKFENCSRYSLIKFDKMVSILIDIIQHEQ